MREIFREGKFLVCQTTSSPHYRDHVTFSSSAQNYGLHGTQIRSACQVYLVKVPISISQTFLELFVHVELV